ncbi:MAG: hypothetical protein CMC89_00130 [Flavobacteriaceae bacterium]|nr:hypothetical protein [Flavobacteriaceae bacterium]|tara:strand:+ start:619 stop:1683 length:1065 start_codon:yes stop_codon:yes gene_type:complete
MSQINKIREGLSSLSSAIETIANTNKPDVPEATVNSISGNAIHGGKITLLRSTGIRDQATRTSLLVEDDQITVGKADIDNVLGDLDIENNLTIGGELKAQKLHVDELFSNQKHTTSIDFDLTSEPNLIGMQWRKKGQATKQIVWRENRFYISSDIDLHREASLKIDDITVINADSLGPTIKKSELTSVGRLTNLQADGDVNIDDFVLYDSGTMRFGIGVEAPNAQFSVASNEAEFVVDPDFDHLRVGAYTTSKLSLITDNKERLVLKEHGGIEVKGSLGVNVQYPGEDVDLQVAGSIRFADKKISVGAEVPVEGNYNLGDLQYNTKPTAGGWVGWICVESGNPGKWKKFGAIEK